MSDKQFVAGVMAVAVIGSSGLVINKIINDRDNPLNNPNPSNQTFVVTDDSKSQDEETAKRERLRKAVEELKKQNQTMPESTIVEDESNCPITTCGDGSCSESVGHGTCSYHRGVASYNY